MYTFNSRVRYSEVGIDERLTLNAVVNYFQDCSIFHSEDIGLGVHRLKEGKRAWLMSSWQVVVNQYPELGEEIQIGTWAYDFNGFYGSRNFVIDDRKGNHFAYANSLWIFMDIERGRPWKITEEIPKGYKIEPKLEMDYAPRKISMPEGNRIGKSFPVRRYHIDTNNHVNNGQYVQMAKEFIPADFKIRQMRAEYKKAAVYGDVIKPKVHEEADAYTIALCDEGEQPYAIVEFS